MLTPQQLEICESTISANAFLWITRDALERKQPLSVVRVADGEKKLYEHCVNSPAKPLEPFGGLTEEWFRRFGCAGIPTHLLTARIQLAAEQATYLAPSINGIAMPPYDLYSLFTPRDRYVDNFFPNLWNEEQKRDLFKLAKHVLFIHGNRKLADAMQARAKHYHGVIVSYLELSNWDQADGVVNAAAKSPASLVIFSAGPASKWIGPAIEQSANKVTLDIGQAANRWSFAEQFEREKARAQELGRLEEFEKSPYTFKP